MRLKSIKLGGFKSFVDPTHIPLPSNLTAIVGPNGCGKSNVIDAVRWVLGESSAKHLRGESMADVIFNGSNARKPVSQASVELVFDNTEGKIGGAYSAYQEIAVKRKVTRDGQSNYYMNGTKCRRKDITDLFLGTGLGPRSYAIIEQGMISRLIEAKPDELRIFIEEAAGISKYKERRRETESRMRRTRENLNRLHDVREELERQLEKLEKQAADARLYTGYQEKQRSLKAELIAIRWRRLKKAVERNEQEILAQETELEGGYAQKIKAEKNIEGCREEHHNVNEQFQKVQAKYYEMGTEIAKVEQNIQHTQEKADALAKEEHRAKEAASESSEHMLDDQKRQEEIAVLLEQQEPDLALMVAQVEETSEQLLVAEELLEDWQTRWEAYQNESADAREQTQVQQSKITHLEGNIQSYGEHLERLETEGKGLSVKDIQQELEALNDKKALLTGEIEQSQNTLDECQEKIESQRSDIRQITSKTESLRSNIRKEEGKLSSLEALQQAALGADDKNHGQWLKEAGLGEAVHLVSQMSVEPGWEKAVEAVLGSDLQSLLQESLTDDMLSRVATSPKSLTLLRSSEETGTQIQGFGLSLLSDKIQSSVCGIPNLNYVYCAKDLDEALNFREQLPPDASIITPDAIWLGPSWVRVSKPSDLQAGVLARQEQIQAIEASIESNKVELSSLEEQLAELNANLVVQEHKKEEAHKSINELNREIGDVNAQIGAKKVRFEQTSMRIERIKEDRQRYLTSHESDQAKLSEARLLLEEAINQMADHESEKDQLVAEKEQNKLQHELARDASRERRDSMHQLQVEVNALTSEKASLDTRIMRANEQFEKANLLLKNIEEQMSALDDVPSLKSELEAKLEDRLIIEEEWLGLRKQVQALEHDMREFEASRQEAESKINALRTHLEQKRLKKQADAVQLDNQIEEAKVMDVDLEVLIENIDEGAKETNWDQRIRSVQKDIDALGPINLAAVEEYEMQGQRKQYLDEQFEDLNTALETLEKAIEKIDKETRERFKETFEQVNSGLKMRFPQVFGGGSAYLELTGDDMLDTGVSIMARPPGKRNSTIHLLSGGEKALTALALVFSIFQLNPAPFCMLDEVDAPLDDANVGRFSKLVESMSKTLQFIYISHNKVTMEMADQLMGVTMHEPGVSRIVSVDVEEAAAMAV